MLLSYQEEVELFSLGAHITPPPQKKLSISSFLKNEGQKREIHYEKKN
jgi:hypothetical protein